LVSTRVPKVIFLLAAAMFGGLSTSPAAESFSGSGTGQRARVVIVQDPAATSAFRTRLNKIRSMVSRGMTNLTDKATVPEAWRSLISTQDVVGIKVVSAPGPNSGTRPAVVQAVVEGLRDAGLPSKQIIIWDKQLSDLTNAGFADLCKRFGVRL